MKIKGFRVGGQPFILDNYLNSGESVSDIEARNELGINRLSQRIADINNHYVKEFGDSPIMKINELTDDGHLYARYFYVGKGCSLERKQAAVKYYRAE